MGIRQSFTIRHLLLPAGLCIVYPDAFWWNVTTHSLLRTAPFLCAIRRRDEEAKWIERAKVLWERAGGRKWTSGSALLSPHSLCWTFPSSSSYRHLLFFLSTGGRQQKDPQRNETSKISTEKKKSETTRTLSVILRSALRLYWISDRLELATYSILEGATTRVVRRSEAHEIHLDFLDSAPSLLFRWMGFRYSWKLGWAKQMQTSAPCAEIFPLGACVCGADGECDEREGTATVASDAVATGNNLDQFQQREGSWASYVLCTCNYIRPLHKSISFMYALV